MDHLREIKPDVTAEPLPPSKRAALRAVKAGNASSEQQQMAHKALLEVCGVNSSACALPGEESVVNWRAGCRWVALYIEDQITLPAEDPVPPLPYPRTITEHVRRREQE